MCEHNSGKRINSHFWNELVSIAVVKGEVSR